MKELVPSRKPGETAYYEEDPFELGDTQLETVADFLPSPEQLVLKEPETEKVTIALSKDSLNFFRQKGKELGAPYQRMIRNLIDAYVAQHRG